MIAQALVAAKLADIATRLAMVEKHRLPSASGDDAAPEARDLVAFNVMLAVQGAADVAAHIVADQSWIAARTAAESFERLAQHGVIPVDLAGRLQRAVAFRNLVAHGYAKLNLSPLHDAATHGAEDLESFMSAVASWTSG